MKNPCIFSKDRLYRYTLLHIWNDKLPIISWVCCNPSTADENQLDPTLRRIKGYSESWGFGSFFMLNAFAYRATDPKVMKSQGTSAIGDENNHWIECITKMTEMTIVGWGEHGAFLNRDKEVIKLIKNPMTLKTTKFGFPSHPLYLKKDLIPFPYKYV